MKKALLLLTLTALTFSCHRETEEVIPEADYLIFGYHVCFCDNCCTTGYKIREGNLFKGVKADLQAPYKFDSTPLEASKYELAKKLIEDLPAELLNENGKLFGCGGCLDQPVYYVELKRNDVVYKWQIDSRIADLPAYMKAYGDALGNVLLDLQ